MALKFDPEGLQPETLRELLIGGDILHDIIIAANNALALGFDAFRRSPDPASLEKLTDLFNEWAAGINNCVVEHNAVVRRLIGAAPSAPETKQ